MNRKSGVISREKKEIISKSNISLLGLLIISYIVLTALIKYQFEENRRIEYIRDNPIFSMKLSDGDEYYDVPFGRAIGRDFEFHSSDGSPIIMSLAKNADFRDRFFKRGIYHNLWDLLLELQYNGRENDINDLIKYWRSMDRSGVLQKSDSDLSEYLDDIDIEQRNTVGMLWFEEDFRLNIILDMVSRHQYERAFLLMGQMQREIFSFHFPEMFDPATKNRMNRIYLYSLALAVPKRIYGHRQEFEAFQKIIDDDFADRDAELLKIGVLSKEFADLKSYFSGIYYLRHGNLQRALASFVEAEQLEKSPLQQQFAHFMQLRVFELSSVYQRRATDPTQVPSRPVKDRSESLSFGRDAPKRGWDTPPPPLPQSSSTDLPVGIPPYADLSEHRSIPTEVWRPSSPEELAAFFRANSIPIVAGVPDSEKLGKSIARLLTGLKIESLKIDGTRYLDDVVMLRRQEK